MQPPTHTMAPMAPISPASITTEQIQKYLDENKQLILAILDNQNLGKLAECAQYQTQLQKNLLYLAAIADAQPPTSTFRPQQGSPFGHQAPVFPPRPSLLFNPQQTHELQQQQQQQQQQQLHHPRMIFPGHMGMRPGFMNGLHSMHAEPSHGGSILASSSMDARGSKQDAEKLTDGQRSSGIDRQRGVEAEPSTLPEQS